VLCDDITRETPASFEPSIDYVVTRIPRFAFQKFPQADPALTTQMKSVGEAMTSDARSRKSAWRAIEDELSQVSAAATFAAMKALVLKDEQFVTDANGKRVGVLLDVKTYEHLREAEEELAEIRAYDTARPKVEADIKAGRVFSLADYRAKRAAKRK
jgi:hypothetical protein